MKKIKKGGKGVKLIEEIEVAWFILKKAEND
jgi:hypothetical protein